MVKGLAFFLVAVTPCLGDFTVSWVSQQGGNGGVFSPDGLEVLEDGTALKIKPSNVLLGYKNGFEVSFSGSYSYLPTQTVQTDGNGGWESTTSDFKLIYDSSGGNGGGTSQVNLQGEWIRGGGIVYDISSIDDQGWFYLVDRSNAGAGEMYFRYQGTSNNLDVGYKNQQGIINVSTGTQAVVSDDGEFERISLDYPNGEATWARPSSGSSGGGSGSGGSGGGDSNDTHQQLQDIQNLMNQIINNQVINNNAIMGQLQLLDLQAAQLDSDDDVPTLQEILYAIQNIDLGSISGSGGSSGGGINSNQVTVNQNGEIEDLREELEEMDFSAENLAANGDEAQEKAALEGIAELGSTEGIEEYIVTIETSDYDPVAMVHKFHLEKQSPLADYGGEINILGGFSQFGIPSLKSVAVWVYHVILLFGFMWYFLHLKGTVVWWLSSDVQSTYSAPVTNYGGSLGGIINGPVKMAQLIWVAGVAVATAIAFTEGYTYEGESIIDKITNALSMVIDENVATASMSAAAGETGATSFAWISTAKDYLFMFVPVMSLLMLIGAAWTLRTGIMIQHWWFVKTSRAMS